MTDEQFAFIKAHALPCPGCGGVPRLYTRGLGPGPAFKFRVVLGCSGCKRRGPEALSGHEREGLAAAAVVEWNKMVRQMRCEPAVAEIVVVGASGCATIAPMGISGMLSQSRGGRRRRGRGAKPQMPAHYAVPANAKGWRKRAR